MGVNMNFLMNLIQLGWEYWLSAVKPFSGKNQK